MPLPTALPRRSHYLCLYRFAESACHGTAAAVWPLTGPPGPAWENRVSLPAPPAPHAPCPGLPVSCASPNVSAMSCSQRSSSRCSCTNSTACSRVARGAGPGSRTAAGQSRRCRAHCRPPSQPPPPPSACACQRSCTHSKAPPAAYPGTAHCRGRALRPPPGMRSAAAAHAPPAPLGPHWPHLPHVAQPLHDEPQRAVRGAHAPQHKHHLARQAARLADLAPRRRGVAPVHRLMQTHQKRCPRTVGLGVQGWVLRDSRGAGPRAHRSRRRRSCCAGQAALAAGLPDRSPAQP